MNSEDGLPLSLEQKLDQVCTRFEAVWKTGVQPRIEDYVADLSDVEQREVLRELILLDVYYRRQRSESCRAEEYQTRFPALPSEWIAQALTPLERSGTAPLKAEVCKESPTPDALNIPGYDILGVLGQGGMGAVYHGHHHDLGREVAVKVLLDKLQDQEEFLRRFVAEAKICGQLQHPGVVPIYELGKLNNQQPYFTMKLVKGQTLDQLLKERAQATVPGRPIQDLPRFVTIFGQVCQAMAYAHARGVIHRDLKPGNVMVGAFGEVQVMDWGLAKSLPRDIAKVSAEDSSGEEIPAIPTTPSDGIPAGSREPRTGAGHVLGTPAYMSPEQARGEIQHLDQRCDVFALGSLLCLLLTGKPAYESPAFERARAGNLAGAWQRLDACGADGELIDLARRCLQPERTDRPDDAGEVAVVVTVYQESVQARAEEERKRREVAQARAEEERKRRRVTVALAATLLLLVSGVGGVTLWYQQNQAQRREEQVRLVAAEEIRAKELTTRRLYVNKEVRAALVDAEEKRLKLRKQLDDPKAKPGVSELLSEPEKWRDQLQMAWLAWQQAQKLAKGNKELVEAEVVAEASRLRQHLEWEQSGYELAEKLDRARQRADTLVDGSDLHAASREYPKVFVGAGLEVKAGLEAALAARMKTSAARPALVAALDHWASDTDDEELQGRLLAIARQVDPDPWRDRFRDVKVWNDLTKLEELEKEVRVEEQSPQLLVALAKRLFEKGGKSAALLRQAVQHHLRDYWLYFHLGYITTDAVEQKGWYQAALAVRPGSGFAHNNLGVALVRNKDLKGALKHFRTAIALEPKDALAFTNLGSTLADTKNLGEAIKHFHTAIQLDPNLASAYYNLGLARYLSNDVEGAIEHFRTAIKLNAKYAMAHNNLGGILLARKYPLGEAIKHLRSAIALDPKLALAQYNLARALHDNHDLKEAIKHYHLAIQLDPKDAGAHFYLGMALHADQDPEGAIKHFRITIDLEPKFAPVHNNLGLVRYLRKDLEGALADFRAAIQLDSNFALAYYNLGRALLHLGQFADAHKATRQCLKLFPPGHPLQKSAQLQLQHCETLLAVESKLTTYLDKRQAPGQPRELLDLIDVCLNYKRYHATTAKLYAIAFTIQPLLAGDLHWNHRYQAARSAALAATGQGRDPARLSCEDKAKLRAQALVWLQVDLRERTKLLQARDLKALPGFLPRLPAWQQEPAFAGFTGGKPLDDLSADEQKDWAKLWAEVGQLVKHLATHVRTERFQGTLTAKTKEQAHEVKLQAGQAYLIDLESSQFDTYLILQDAKGKTLKENDDIAPPWNLNSRLIFTAPADGTYRLVATSFMQQETGVYTLTVREFVKKAE